MPTKRKPPKWWPDGECETCGVVHVCRVGKGGQKPCAGHTTVGKACGAAAINGGWVCRRHGGEIRAVKDLAAKRFEDQQHRDQAGRILRLLGEPPRVDPITALLDLIGWKYAEVQFYRERVAELIQPDPFPAVEGTEGHPGTPAQEQPHPLIWGTIEVKDKTGGEDWGTTTVQSSGEHAWLRLMHEAEHELADMAAKALKAGIAERQVRVAEQQGMMLAKVIRSIAVDVLTALQRAGLPGDLTRIFQQTLDSAAHQHLTAMDIVQGQVLPTPRG